MKARLQAMLFATVMTLPLFVFAQSPTAKTFSDTATRREKSPDSMIAPNAIPLSADDQKQLDLINDRITTMKPQLEAAQKQRDDAQSKLNEANSFIAQYNQIDTIRMAFLFRIAADVCKCETKDLEFSADGKSVVKKVPLKK